MANLEKQFDDFIEKVYISNNSNKSFDLRKSRDNARNKTKAYFEEKGFNKPDFRMQGSFKMNTIITPLSGEYDLDDGVYLNNLEGSVDTWASPDTVHGWVRNALNGITDEPPINKKSCIRLRYRDNYHIDFPIYGMDGSTQYYAVSGEKWKENENYPKEYTEWFNTLVQKNDQIRKVVILIKAWKDFQQYSNEAIKLPSGVILTTLVGYNFVKDDELQYAFLATLANIYKELEKKFTLKRPVAPYNDFLNEYSKERKQHFLKNLKNIVDDKSYFEEEKDAEKASERWQKHLGDRFPLAEKPLESIESATIGNQRSA